MKWGSGRSGGYTIVETMIFLAVSGLLVVMAIILVSGQQGKTEFAQAVRDFESRLQDLSNDVSTGYSSFNFTNGENCWYDASGGMHVNPAMPSNANRCVFIGRAVQFGVDGDKNMTSVYSVVGNQHTAANKEVTTIAEANPAPLVNQRQDASVNGAATIERVRAGGIDVGAFGFFTTFQNYASGSLSSGSLAINVVPVIGSTIGETNSSIENQLKDPTKLTTINPAGGIVVCLKSSSSNQYGLISVGGAKAGRLTVSSEIKPITGASPLCS